MVEQLRGGKAVSTIREKTTLEVRDLVWPRHLRDTSPQGVFLGRPDSDAAAEAAKIREDFLALLVQDGFGAIVPITDSDRFDAEVHEVDSAVCRVDPGGKNQIVCEVRAPGYKIEGKTYAKARVGIYDRNLNYLREQEQDARVEESWAEEDVEDSNAGSAASEAQPPLGEGQEVEPTPAPDESPSIPPRPAEPGSKPAKPGEVR